jgi:hypothetical protein
MRQSGIIVRRLHRFRSDMLDRRAVLWQPFTAKAEFEKSLHPGIMLQHRTSS